MIMTPRRLFTPVNQRVSEYVSGQDQNVFIFTFGRRGLEGRNWYGGVKGVSSVPPPTLDEPPTSAECFAAQKEDEPFR